MTTTTNTGLNQPVYNSTSPTWDQPLNFNETILDAVFGNTTSIAMPTGASSTTTLTGPTSTGSLGQTQAMRIVLTGSLSANQILQFPSGVAGKWVIYNTTSGSFSVTVSSAGGGTAVSAPQGYNVSIYSDGTNIRYTDDGLTNNFATLTVLGNTYLATTSGNVGIGTSSPIGKLAITTAATAVNALVITDATNYTLEAGYGGSGVGFIGGTASTALALWANNSEKARIDTSGNVGIGVIPSATSLPTIQSTYGALTGNSQLNLVSNAYYNSGWKYVGTGLATQYLANAGVHSWSTAVSGTAGGTVSFSESMRIDSSGNVGIGTSSPSTILTVNGTVTATSVAATSGTFSNGVQGTTIAAAGFGVRVVAGSGDTAGLIQFTNNAISAQWSSISSTNGVINLNSTTTNANAINASSVNATSYSGGLVTSVAAGSGISVSANQGAVTITNTSPVYGLGINQSWQNVSRALGSTYTNSTGSPIMVIVSVASAAGNYQTLNANVNGTSFLIGQDANSGGATYCTGTFVVPNGHYYIVTGTGGAGLQQWVELR